LFFIQTPFTGSYFCRILGAFLKLRKATISFSVYVRLSAWNISAPTERNFMKVLKLYLWSLNPMHLSATLE